MEKGKWVEAHWTHPVWNTKRTTTLKDHAEYIRTDRGLRRDTIHARAQLKAHGKKSDEYDNAKLAGRLPTYGGYFEDRRLKDTLTNGSGYVVHETDDLPDHEQAAEARNLIFQHPAVAFTHISKSGIGVHIVAAVSPVPQNDDEYKLAWEAARQALGIRENDEAVKDVSRVMYPAFDPDALYREDVEPIPWERPQPSLSNPAKAERKAAPKSTAAGRGQPLVPLSTETLERIFEHSQRSEAAYNHDTTYNSDWLGIPTNPPDMSRWDQTLMNAYYIDGGQDDDEALGLMACHQLRWGEPIEAKDYESYYIRTRDKARDGRKNPNTTADAKPASTPTEDADADTEPADTDTPNADAGDAPTGAPPRKLNRADELLLSLIDEPHAATLFGAAERLVAVNADDLLMASFPNNKGVQQGQPFTLTSKGLWQNDEPTLRAKLVNNERRTIELTLKQLMETQERSDETAANKLDKKLKGLMDNRRSILNNRSMTALDHAPSVTNTWGLKRLKVKDRLTFAQRTDLDSQTGFLGTDSGVINLATGKLLNRSEGRKYLVSLSTGIRFDPDAKHPAVDKMTAHMGDEVADFLWATLGRALWGIPEHFILCIGPTHTGKSTLTSALTSALGPYTKSFSHDLIRPESDQRRKSGPSPERAMLAGPRIGIAHETKTWDIDNEKLKTITSGGADLVPFQAKYMAEVSVRPTATLLLFANDVPKMQLWAPSMFVRLVAIPLVHPGETDRTLKPSVKADPAVAKAVLARLVRAAYENPPPDPIAKPPMVRAFEDRLREDSLDAVTAFCFEHLDYAPYTDKLSLEDIWAAFCKVHKVPASSDSAAGYLRQGFGLHIQEAMELSYKVTKHRFGDTSKRGFRGLRFKTA